VVTAVAVVVGLISVVFLLSLISGRGEEDGASPEATTSTTRPPPPVTTLPRPSSSSGPILAGGERLDPGFEMAAVSIRSNGTVVVADLATGDERVLEERIPLAPVQVVSWIGSTFVARSVGDELHRLVPGTTNDWEVVDTLGLGADPYWPGPPGLVYLWDPDELNAAGMRFGLVGSTGALRLIDGPASVFLGTPVGMLGDAAVFNTPDGIYQLGPDQPPRRLALGFALGTEGERLVRRSCDDSLECRILLDEPLTGSVTDLGALDPGATIQRVVPSPDGQAVAMVALVGDELTIRILPVPSGRSLTWVIGRPWSEPHMLQWSSDGDGLVWLDTERREIRSLRWRGDAPSSEPSAARMQDLAPTSSFEANFVIPLEALPRGWSPHERLS
jgi:hypothetical protein